MILEFFIIIFGPLILAIHSLKKGHDEVKASERFLQEMTAWRQEHEQK